MGYHVEISTLFFQIIYASQMDEELEVEIPDRRVSPSPTTPKERRPSSASRLPKIKAQANASLQFTQQLQGRIATTTSNSTTPHFEYGIKRKATGNTRLVPLTTRNKVF